MRTATEAPLQGGRQEIVNRLNRIEGQVRGITRMVEQDRRCIDMLTQLAAVSGALQGAALILLESHLRTCLTGHGLEVPEEQVKEASAAIARLVRS